MQGMLQEKSSKNNSPSPNLKSPPTSNVADTLQSEHKTLSVMSKSSSKDKNSSKMTNKNNKYNLQIGSIKKEYSESIMGNKKAAQPQMVEDTIERLQTEFDQCQSSMRKETKNDRNYSLTPKFIYLIY